MNCLQCFIAFMQPVVKLDSGHLPDLEKALASGGIIDLCGCTFSGELAQSILLVGSNTTLCNGTILLPNNSLVRTAGGTYLGGRLKIVCRNVCLSVTLGGDSNLSKSNTKGRLARKEEKECCCLRVSHSQKLQWNRKRMGDILFLLLPLLRHL
jgi:hypothetical protein